MVEEERIMRNVLFDQTLLVRPTQSWAGVPTPSSALLNLETHEATMIFFEKTFDLLIFNHDNTRKNNNYI